MSKKDKLLLLKLARYAVKANIPFEYDGLHITPIKERMSFQENLKECELESVMQMPTPEN